MLSFEANNSLQRLHVKYTPQRVSSNATQGEETKYLYLNVETTVRSKLERENKLSINLLQCYLFFHR